MNLTKDKLHVKAAAVCDLPNLMFQQYCEEHYGTNKGVFNTIDIYLYRRGNIEIVKRRQTMLYFFYYMADQSGFGNSGGKLKFGHGGLASSLASFFDSLQSGC